VTDATSVTPRRSSSSRGGASSRPRGSGSGRSSGRRGRRSRWQKLTSSLGLPPPKRRNPATRYDLQGVRGVGVILVVLGHLYLAPQGIFTALDIFFVLSGFVITKVLLDMADEHGRIYFVPFYLARARRLLPMGLFVTAVTIGAGYLVFNPARGDQIAEEGFWSTIFWANWHFADAGTDYFATQGKSPFLHYWSLSVEEQFYAVWPLLLFLVILASRRLRSNQVALFAAVSVVVVGAFGYSLWHSAAAPTVAYFSTFDRAWEFGVGGLLAIAQPLLARIPSRAAVALSWGGFLSLAFPIFLLDHTVAFPAPWGLLPVLCTAAIVAAGVGRDTQKFFLIDNRFINYVGDISYSVYLWHLPLIVMLRPLIEVQWQYEVAVLSLTAVLSVVFFHLVEKPMRRAGFLMTPPERRRLRRRVRREERARQRKRLAVGWAVTLSAIMVLASVVVGTVRPSEFSPASGARPADTDASATSDEVVEVGSAAAVDRAAQLRTALASNSFPVLDVPLESLNTEQWRRQLEEVACSTRIEDRTENCVFGNDQPGAPTAVVVGDSVAAAWMPGLLEALGSEWRVVQLTESQCGAWTLPSYVRSDGSPYPECEQAHQERERVLAATNPELVVLSSGEGHVRNAQRDDIELSRTGVAEFGLAATIETYGRWAGRIIVLQPRPVTPALVNCITRLGAPGDCEGDLGPLWRSQRDGESAAAQEAGAEYISTERWFCVEGRCPGWIGASPATVDGTHLSIEVSRSTAPLLAEALGVRESPPTP